MASDLHLGLATGIVVSYIGPFTKCEVGRLEEPWSALHDPELARLHARLLGYRNTLYAHNDRHAEAREVYVLPGDAWGTGQALRPKDFGGSRRRVPNGSDVFAPASANA